MTGRSPRRRGSLAEGRAEAVAWVDPRAGGEARGPSSAAGNKVDPRAGGEACALGREGRGRGRSPRRRGSRPELPSLEIRTGRSPRRRGSLWHGGSPSEPGSIPAQAGKPLAVKVLTNLTMSKSWPRRVTTPRRGLRRDRRGAGVGCRGSRGRAHRERCRRARP